MSAASGGPDRGPIAGASSADTRGAAASESRHKRPPIQWGKWRASFADYLASRVPPEARQRQDSEKKNRAERERNAQLDKTVAVTVVDGTTNGIQDKNNFSRESLSPDAQRLVRSAQEELARLQEAELAGKSAEARAAKIQNFRSENRVVVVDGGNTVMLVRGNQEGYDIVAPDGQLKLKTYDERVEDSDGTRTVERPGEVSIVRVTLETTQARTATGESLPVKRIRVIDANSRGEGRQISDSVDVFKNLGDNPLQMTYTPSGETVNGMRVFVLNVGAGSNALSAEGHRIIADIQDGKITVPAGSTSIDILGAGADRVKIPNVNGGDVSVANIFQRWQKEGTKAEENSRREMQVLNVAMSAPEARQFNQLPLSEQRAFVGRLTLPRGYDNASGKINVLITGVGDLPIGTVTFPPETDVPNDPGRQLRADLNLQASIALARTQQLLDRDAERLKIIRSATDSVEPTALVLVIGRGNAGYESPNGAMEKANAFVNDLSIQVGEEFRNPTNTRSRKEIAKSLIEAQFPTRDAVGDEFTERLATQIGGSDPQERIIHLLNARKPEGQTRDAFIDGLAQEAFDGIPGFAQTIDEAKARVEALKGQEITYSAGEILKMISDAQREIVSSEENNVDRQGVRARIQGEIDKRRKAAGLSAEESAQLDRMETVMLDGIATRPQTVEDFRANLDRTIMDASNAGDNIASTELHRNKTDILAAIEASGLPDYEKAAKRRLVELLDPEQPVEPTTADRQAGAYNEFASLVSRGEMTREDLRNEMLRILAGLRQGQERNEAAVVLGRILGAETTATRGRVLLVQDGRVTDIPGDAADALIRSMPTQSTQSAGE